MPRAKGSKNKPKDPDLELAKLRALFKEMGRDLPGDIQDHPAKSPVDAGYGQATPGGSDNGDQVTFITDQDAQPGVDNDLEYECGSCGAELPGALRSCPNCGCSLEWQL